MNAAAVIQVPQDRETLVEASGNGWFHWRYAYARSADTRATGGPGQDYLTFRCHEHSIAFALCDGVSQSFFGDLAARHLGDALVQWLWDGIPAATDAETIRGLLAGWLRELMPEASRLVNEQPIPEHLPRMLVEVLEQKRRMGSETMFVAGRIDLPQRDLPVGKVVLAWMGDSRLRLWRGRREITDELGDEFRTSERWSTSLGPVGGSPHVHICDVGRRQRRLTALAVYSDGLALLDRPRQVPSNADLQDVVAQAGESAMSDDISLLHIWLAESHDS